MGTHANGRSGDACESRGAMTWRSLLCVPGDRPDRIAKAADRGAHAVIVDLEDGVAANAKAQARAALAQSIPMLAQRGTDVLVRINAEWLVAIADIEAAVAGGACALVVPKVETTGRIAALAEILAEVEAKQGRDQGSVEIVALIESPVGLENMTHIVKQPRMRALALGSEDFALALAAEPSAASLDLPCRMLAIAAAAARRASYGLPISIGAFGDLEAYEQAALAARAYGMTGAIAIHPTQLTVINRVFTASKSERAAARRIVEAWEAVPSECRSVIALEGRMIDLPVVLRARRLLGLEP